MLQRARSLCRIARLAEKLGGEVEVDETFIGGLARNMHKDKRAEKITGTGPQERPSLPESFNVAGKCEAR